jgi:polyisoprenoid-binding protein YceI
VAITQSTEVQPISLPPGEWHVDPSRSELGFLTHILFGLIAVRGRYSGYDGELHIDGAGNASGALRVEAAMINTGITKRDAHLRSTDFFATDEHPYLKFELASLDPGADGAVTMARQR